MCVFRAYQKNYILHHIHFVYEIIQLWQNDIIKSEYVFIERELEYLLGQVDLLNNYKPLL